MTIFFRFEKLDITLKSAKKIKPVLENWMREAEEKYRHNKIIGNVVTPEALVNGLNNFCKDKDNNLLSSSSSLSIAPLSSFKISSALELVNNIGAKNHNHNNNNNNPNVNNDQRIGIVDSMNKESSQSPSPSSSSSAMISSNVNIYKAFMETNKKRKRRTSFTPSAIDALNNFFEQNNHPNGEEMTKISEILNYDRDVVRVWFCNKRQATKAKCKNDLDNSTTTINSNQSQSISSINNDQKSNNSGTKVTLLSTNDVKTSSLETMPLGQSSSSYTNLTLPQPSSSIGDGGHNQFFRPIHPSHGQALRSSLSNVIGMTNGHDSIPSVANIAPFSLGRSTTTTTNSIANENHSKIKDMEKKIIK